MGSSGFSPRVAAPFRRFWLAHPCGVGSRKGGAFVLLYLSGEPACQARLQRIQSTAFISHLTNSNGCGNLQVKVLRQCPRFVPVSPRAPLPTQGLSASVSLWQIPSFHQLSALYLGTRHSPLATSPLFSSTCRLFVAPKKVNSFAIKQIQPLFAKCRGGGGIPNASTGHPGWGAWPPAIHPGSAVRLATYSLLTTHYPLPTTHYR
jgi:hypothetical protein